jgi:hypothetical protein
MSSACTYKHNILDLKKEFMSDVLRLESPRLLKTHVLGRQALGYHKGGNRGVVCTLLTASGFYFWTRSWHLDIWKVGLRHKGGLYLCSSSRALEFALWGAKTRGRPSGPLLSLPSSPKFDHFVRCAMRSLFVCEPVSRLPPSPGLHDSSTIQVLFLPLTHVA